MTYRSMILGEAFIKALEIHQVIPTAGVRKVVIEAEVGRAATMTIHMMGDSRLPEDIAGVIEITEDEDKAIAV